MPTEKRQRQKAARRARLEAEAKARKRKQTMRRSGIGVVILALIVALSLWLTSGSSKPATKAASSTTTTVPAFTYTPSSSPGGSGDKSPSAITTSADCPSNLKATLNKPSYPNGPTGTHINTSKTYTAAVKTDVGSFTITLAPKAAPLAVNSFVFLARQHFFDCVVFHRVIPGFVDQTGDP
ncbi:MAG: peptidylprolyl isomerase, partial [Actinomycetota bacterium]|nr:peptidylprolyl isomerase [Actinomycetota bacterium]